MAGEGPGLAAEVPGGPSLPPAVGSSGGEGAVRRSFAQSAASKSLPVKSFAEVLQASLAFEKVVILVHDPAFTDKGESACFFNKDEIGASLSPVRFAVIAKTPYGRPPFQEIRNHIQQRCSLTGCFVISSIDSLHLLIRFALEDDFLKVLLRESLLVRGKVFKFFKWSPLLRPNEDPHIIPVWIDLPGLPINLYQECFVRSIACNVGKVLQVAHDTVNLINTQAARVCVEVDLLLPLKERIWIGMGDCGYWQVILYPRLPAYCTTCKRIGHGADSCGTPVTDVHKESSVPLKKNQAPLPNPTTKTIEPAPKQNTTANWRQVSKGKRKNDIQLPSDVPSTSTSNMFNLLDSSSAGEVEEAADGVKEDGSCPAPVVCPSPPAAPAASPISQIHITADDKLICAEAVVPDLHGVGVSEKAHASAEVDVHGNAVLPCGGGSSGVRASPETRPVLEEGETPVNLDSRDSVADVALEGFLQVSSKAAVESSVALAKQAERIQEGCLATNSGLNPHAVDPMHTPSASLRTPVPQADSSGLNPHAAESVAMQVSSPLRRDISSCAGVSKPSSDDVDYLHADFTPKIIADVAGVVSTDPTKSGLSADKASSTVTCRAHVGSSEALQLIPRGNMTDTSEDIPLDAGDVPTRLIASPGQLSIPVASYKAVLQTPQATADLVAKNVSSSSSGRRKITSQPSRKGRVRICLPASRVRSPSPPPLAANSQIQINMEAVRAIMEQSRAENIFMPGYMGESDDHDDDDDTFYDERCRRRPGLRPRGVLRRKHSYDDLSLEF